MAGRQNPNPISFKTVPNRNKTQKWQQAKTYNYDGDDWGGYDPYDEYSYDDPPPPPNMHSQPPAMPSQPPQGYAQQQGYGRPAPRKNSFDQGDERRNFSAGPVMYGGDSRSSASPARSNVSGGDYNDGRPRSRPRDFTNPEQVPPPLAMRGSPAPAGFPPRKSSVSTGSPAPEIAPMPATRNEEKELPVPPMIRPSDIYRRMEAEREKERQSMEGSRPSMDSLQRETSSDSQWRPLSSVHEDFGEPVSGSGHAGPPMLPSVRNMSGIGTSFLHGSGEAGQTPVQTRAPGGKDPAAEILAERTNTRAPPGSDPAADILAERTPTRAQPGSDPADDILAERTPTRAQPGFDPAADILAERTVTRAQPGSDPAADILAERTPIRTQPSYSAADSQAERSATRAMPGSDPARDILAERTATRAQPGSDPAADILAERSTTRALPGSDPAADIMAERGHDQHIDEPESGVEHHYRSMVDQAFDNDSAQNSASLSRDSSVYSQSIGGTGVSRNNSNSTAGISPIMSRVPSAATAKMQQLERERQVPTIAEEPSQRGTPVHSRNVSAGSNELYHPGYRRSMDPPSGDNSPRRTPGLENAHSRQVSQPMSAETETAEPPAVPDQGVEMMPDLEPAETPASEMPTPAPLPITGRSRAGTDYSMRESDIAREASTSPEKNEFSPSIAQAAFAEQTTFLQDHAGTPTSQWPPASPSGRNSPAKSRVREIAGKYQTIEAESRRGSTTSSKSSWSNFRGSNEDLTAGGLKKRGTGESGLGAELGQTASEGRPPIATQMSFRPGLPGQWVSFAGTPGETPGPVLEEPASRGLTPEPSLQSPEEEEAPDFSPNTDKHKLSGYSPYPHEQPSRDFTPSPSLQSPQQEGTPDFSPTTDKQKLSGYSPSSPEQAGFIAQAKGVGETLGASLMSSVGMGHQTRDFASKEPPAPVEQPVSHRPIGEMGYYNTRDRPELNRGDTDASMATDIASSASSVPPTPPAKEGLSTLGAQHGQAPRARQLQEESRPISNYFSGAVAPLRPSKDHLREASANTDLPKLGPMTNLSTASREEDTESDRLRREIVRSLSPTASREDDLALTQDALDAPDNMRKVEAGRSPEPAVEAGERPGLGLIGQRFSWEDRGNTKGLLDSSPAAARTRDVPTVREPEPDPEVKPEMPYERPRSRGLHIVNPEGDDSSDDEQPLRQTPQQQRMLGSGEKGIVSPFTPSQENLRDGLDSREVSRDNTSTGAPSPAGLDVVDSRDTDGDSSARIPSYYMQGQHDNLALPRSPSLTQQSPTAESSASPTSLQTAIPADRSPTSPTSAAAAANTTRPRGQTTSKIPPFREILANKDTGKRMDLYNSTRRTFADTDTGLGDWLEGMLERNPEYANVGTRLQPSASSLGAMRGMSHKHSPSLAKFKQLGSTFGGDGVGGASGIRRSSTTREVSGGSASGGNSGGRAYGDGAGGAPPPLPPKDAMWEQRGKDLMKGAGVLGGKAQAGAKGLLMKGRSRFGTKRESGGREGGGGGEKALPPLPSSTPTPPPHSTATPPPPSRTLTGTSRFTDSLLVPTASNSSSSAEPSRAPSQPPSQPPSRSPSQPATSRTPSSLSISRTFSRLRERRSQSKSSIGGSRSRPDSLVITTSNPANLADAVDSGGGSRGLDTGSELGGGSELRLGTLQDASPVAITSVPAGATGLVHTSGSSTGADRGPAGGDFGGAGSAISPWSEPEDFIPARNEAVSPWDEPDEREVGPGEEQTPQTGLLQRLGVLPSPTATAFSSSPTKTMRGRQGSEVSGFAGTGRSRQGSAVSGFDGTGRSRQGSRVDETIDEHGAGDEEIKDVAGSTQENVPKSIKGDEVKGKPADTYEDLQRGWGTDSDTESVGKENDARPEYERTESARALLPSQLKSSSQPQTPRSPSSPKSPRSPRALGQEDEEDLYESTPKQTQFSKQARQVVGEGNVDGERETLLGQEMKDEAEKNSERVREDSAFDLAGLRDTGAPGESTGATEESEVPGGFKATSAEATPTRTAFAKEVGQTGPSPVQDWDRHSAVSSAGDFHDAKEGDETTTPSYRAGSRRSSVSSLGNAGVEEPMSSQAVPAGPTGLTQQAEREMADTAQRERFMNRSYRFGGERPMSYMPLGTTASGAPVQESLDDNSRPESTSVDLSGISGPPVGVLPYQKHPAMRDPELAGGLPGDHGGLRSPPPAPDTNPIAATVPTPRPRQVSAETRDRGSKRFSSFFRSRQLSQTATTVYGPAPSAITDQYGLENVQTGPDAVARPGTQRSGETQQAKRQSGIWNSFKRSSVMLPAEDSRQSSIAALPSRTDLTRAAPQQVSEAPATRVNTLKKPQRATTSAATPPAPEKKKRFSVLGSLFGRSSTTGHKTERPRKLMKQPNSSQVASQTQIPGTSSVTTGYEAFEEARRRQAKQQRPRSPQIGPPLQERADLTTAAIQFPHVYDAAPQQGWYGPDQTERQQQYRTLHSERERVDLPLENMPESFRPVDSSYGRAVAPIGPPSPADMSPISQGHQRSFSGGYHGSPSAQQHTSYGSNEYDLSPQVSGGSEYQAQAQGWRSGHGSSHSISPVHSRTGSDNFPPPRQMRMGSIGGEIARTPAQPQGYSDQQQQRPYGVSMPPPAANDGSRRSVSGPAWASQGGAERYESYEDYGYSQGPYPQMQVLKQRGSGSYYAQAPTQPPQSRYSSAPYSSQPASYQPSGPYQQSYAPAPAPGFRQQGYYSNPTCEPSAPSQQHQVPRQYSGAPRPPSGYTGRRDEPALGEDVLDTQMRGTSYPGQEWAPGRWD